MNSTVIRIIIWTLNGILLCAAMIGLYFAINYSSEILLQDKEPTAVIPEGKYIINVLADDYESFLKEKGQNLDRQRIELLTQKEIAKSRKEKRQIEEKLRDIEAEKKDVVVEFDRNEQQRKEIEKNLKNTQENLEKSRQEIDNIRQKNAELAVRNEATANYMKDYIYSIKTDFMDIYKNNPKKTSEIETGFSNENGLNFIAGEFKDIHSFMASNDLAAEIKKQNDDLKKTLRTMTNGVAGEKDRKIAELTKENEDLKNSLNVATNTANSDKDKTIAALMSENRELNVKLDKFTASEVPDRNLKIAQLTKENTDLKNKLEKQMNRQDSEKDKKIAELTKEIERISQTGSKNIISTEMTAKGEPSFMYTVRDLNDPVEYKGNLIATSRNQLIIASIEGKKAKSVSVVKEDFNLTRPAVSDDIIYVGSDEGGIYTYNLSGDLLWKMKAGSQKYGASPAAGFGLVAVPSIDDGIVIYDSKGKLISKIYESDPVFSAPLLIRQGTILIYATQIGDIKAYNILNNSRVWNNNYYGNINESIHYPLTGDDNVVIALLSSGRVIAVKASDGSPMWWADFAEIKNTAINPRFVNGKLILANNSARSVIIIVNAANGFVEAKSLLGNERIRVPYLSGDSIHFSTDSGNVYSYKFK